MSQQKRLGGPRLKSFLEDFAIPFLFGFAVIFVIFWIRSLFDVEYEKIDLSDNIPSRPPTFLDKNGQLYLVRHGIQQKAADILRAKADRLQFTIQAKASENFKMTYIRKDDRIASDDEPPGAIWPWPRIELEAPATPIVWVVTPTYRNPYQYAELTRIAQAIYPARRFVRWLVVDDTTRSKKYKYHIGKLDDFLIQFKVNFTILRSKPKPKSQRSMFKPKGVDGRRTALEYIRRRKLLGVVYFADDDNTYDSDIFRQIQATKTVSVWPTGAITQWIISSPVVNSEGKVIDFFDAFTANRKFPVDFASFAINTELIINNPKVNIPWIQGYEETILLATLKIDKSEFIPLAANATQVLTWHTKTIKLNRNQHGIDVGSKKSFWPETIQKLLKKYDFLFDYVHDEPGSSKRKSRMAKRTKTTPQNLTKSDNNGESIQ